MNSTNDTNQFITTTKEAFDANPPEQTNSSIITYSCIGGGTFLGLSIGLLICRKAVMSRMLKQEVNRDAEWEYNPYESAAPKIATVAKARMAISKMQEEAAYRKYYELEGDTAAKRVFTIGKAAMFVNAFLSAKTPEEHKVAKVEKAAVDIMKLAKGVNAFKEALGGASTGRGTSQRYAEAAHYSDKDYGPFDLQSRPEAAVRRHLQVRDPAGDPAVSESLDIDLEF
mmetsp:Transcript_39038/g.110578  ORF Transcript_39038/g.110578 Transcript_39038/m.110578 type:complete len:227 (-) Transcript_39038:836-1516(-)